jgi:hypothetical protein
MPLSTYRHAQNGCQHYSELLCPDKTLGGESDFAYAHHNLAHAALNKDPDCWKVLQTELSSIEEKSHSFFRSIFKSQNTTTAGMDS